MARADTRPIVIVGAGIGGLTAALALLRAGFPVGVAEQAAALGELGAGLTLAPNGSRVLEALGLGERLRRIACLPGIGAIRHWRTGEAFSTSDRGGAAARFGAPYCQVHRADLHAILAEAVLAYGPHRLLLDHRFAGCLDEGGAVGVRFANGATLDARSLIGADGARSAVRAQLLNASSPEFTGYCAWRGLAPVAALPPGTLDYPSCLYVGPHRMFARYLVRGGELVNFVAAVREPRWRLESWSARGDPAEVLAAFAGFHAPVRAILGAVPPDSLHKWALYSREPLLQWVAGRVGLLGDAAHPMLPFMGQGAVMAIEDAMVLARAFAAEPDDPAAALARYQRARLERATLVQRQSAARGLALLAADPDDYGRRPTVNEDTLGLFEYDATAVAV
ncbi:MAG: FAD-dependent monooxygenase [Pseudomonadota bacterium]